MKKRINVIFSIILSIVLIGQCTMAAFATNSNSDNYSYFDKKVIENFDSFSTSTAWCWGGGFNSGMLSNDAGTLKASYPVGEGATFSVPISTPASDVDAVGFTMDASGMANVFCMRLLFSIDPDYVNTAEGKEFYLVDATGSSRLEIGASGNMDIPAGFKGQIIVPIASFAETGSDWTSQTIYSKENLRFQFKITSTLADVGTVKYDDLAYFTVDTGTVEKFNYDKEIGTQNFDNLDLGSVWSWGTISSSNVALDNGALKVTYPRSDNACLSIEAATPSKNFLGTSLDVDASSVPDAFNMKFMFGVDPDYVTLKKDSDYYLVNGATSKKYAVAESGLVVIPAGFKGQLIIPAESYDEFEATNWNKDSLYSATSNLRYQIRVVSGISANSIVKYDNFKYLEKIPPEVRINLGDKKIIEEFTNFGNEIKGDGKLCCWGDSIAYTDFSADDNKLTVNYRIGNNSAWSVGVSSPSDLAFASTIKIDASKATEPVKLKFYFSEKENYIYTAPNAIYYLVDGEEGIEKNIAGDGTISFEPGFVGTIAIPFTSYTTDAGINWSYKDCYTSGGLELQVRAFDVASTNKISFDDFGYINEYGAKYTLPYKGKLPVIKFNDDYKQELKEDWSGKFGCWGNGVKFSNFSVGKGLLKASYPAGDDLAWSTDINNPYSDARAVYTTLDLSEIKYSVSIRMLFSKGNNYIQSTAGKACYLVCSNGTVDKINIGKEGNIALPVGFKGNVVVPFESFVDGQNMKISEIRTIEGLEFQLRVYGIKNAGSVVYFDEVGYMTESAVPMTGDSSMLWVYTMVLIISLAGIILSARSLMVKKND